MITSSLLITFVRILSSLCALGLTLLVARNGAEDLGAFRTLLVFFLIADFLPLLGMHTFVIREVALHAGKLKAYLLHSFVLALAVSMVAGVVLLALAKFGNYSPTIGRGLVVLCSALPASAANLCAIAALVGLGKGVSFGMIQGLETVARTIVSVVCLLAGWGILAVIISFVVVRWLILFFYWTSIAPHAREERWKWDTSFFRSFVSHIPTFAGIALLAIVSRFLAQLMLPWMTDNAAAGQFAVAYVFIDIMLLAPTAMVTILAPQFAQNANVSMDLLSHACKQGAKLMGIVMIPCAALIMMEAQTIIHLLFHSKTGYDLSPLILQIIIWVAFIMAVDQVLAAAIISCKKQVVDLQTLCVGSLVLLVALNLFIRSHGAVGAGLGLLAGSVVMLFVRFVLVGRHITGLNPLTLFWRPAVASAGMCLAVVVLANMRVPWLLQIALGGGIYLLLMALFGSFAQSERTELLTLLHKTSS